MNEFCVFCFNNELVDNQSKARTFTCRTQTNVDVASDETKINNEILNTVALKPQNTTTTDRESVTVMMRPWCEHTHTHGV